MKKICNKNYKKIEKQNFAKKICKKNYLKNYCKKFSKQIFFANFAKNFSQNPNFRENRKSGRE